VPDLEALDAGIIGVTSLHRGDHETRGVAQVAGLVERGLVSSPDEAAVAFEQRQFVRKAACKFMCEIA
jgi:hypothetical protein